MKKEIEEILEENSKRVLEADSGFDPISGKASVGERFETNEPGNRRKRVWLPISMKGLKLTQKNYDELRILHDFPYWAAKYVKIKQKGGGDDINFVLNRPQRKFVEALERDRLNGSPIRLILLKARQWGGSTCSQIYMAWLQLIHKTGLNSLIIAHQGVASDEIKDMYDRMIASYSPFEERERKLESVGRSRALFRVAQRNCKIKIGTAERPDSCRGGDYNLVHCSEVGLWKKTDGKSPEDILRSACSGILYKPYTMIVYESTANGTGTFFHREYEAAKEGISQFSALFISWFEIEKYSLPFASEKERSDFAVKLYNGRMDEYATTSRAQPGKYMWWLWRKGATLEALHWYEVERAKYSDHGLMAAEYPSDDVEAFLHSGARVFDKYKVEALREGCAMNFRRGDIGVDGFISVESGNWQVWKEPEKVASFENRYVAVVDIGGRSLKSDWSVIAVFDRYPMAGGGKPEVVAQWRGHCDFDILTAKAAAVAEFYDNALLVIESNTLETSEYDRGGGYDLSSTLLSRLKENYPNLYARRNSQDAVVEGAPVRYGFHTNLRTKPMIITTLVEVVRDSLYVERDKMCLDEYLVYEQRQNGSYGAIAGCHDDILMTRAIGLHIIYHELEMPQLSVSKENHEYKRYARSRPIRNFASW